jgi:hypothetical protein
MEKISQRTEDDCVICVLAMVMGPPYNYERVLQDSKKYRRTDDKGRTVAWWKDYLEDEGFEIEHRPLSDSRSFSDLASLPENSRAMLVFRMPHLKIGHIVAIDRCGVIEPQLTQHANATTSCHARERRTRTQGVVGVRAHFGNPSYPRRSSSSTTFPYSEIALPSRSSVSGRTGNRGFSARAHMFSPDGLPSSREKCQPKFVKMSAVS